MARWFDYSFIRRDFVARGRAVSIVVVFRRISAPIFHSLKSVRSAAKEATCF